MFYIRLILEGSWNDVIYGILWDILSFIYVPIFLQDVSLQSRNNYRF